MSRAIAENTLPLAFSRTTEILHYILDLKPGTCSVLEHLCRLMTGLSALPNAAFYASYVSRTAEIPSAHGTKHKESLRLGSALEAILEVSLSVALPASKAVSSRSLKKV